MLDLKKEDSIMTASGMDEGRRYALIRKMNVLQGKDNLVYAALYIHVKQ